VVQARPFRVKALGLVLLPLKLAWKPKAAVPPAGMTLFQPPSLALTTWPVCVGTAFQALVICWLPPKVHASVQPFTEVPPVLRTVTSATKPVCHWLEGR